MSNMPDTATSYSPVHHHLDKLGAKWTRLGDRQIAAEVGNPEHQNIVALCDLSALPKLGVKGDRAESWLADAGIDVPTAMFGFNRLSDDGFVIRAGGNEFFLEAGLNNTVISALPDGEPGAYRLQRDDATFLMTGQRVHEALLQTCGVNLPAEPDDRVIYSRVAGVNAALCPQTLDGRRAYRLWLDYTQADYLWEELNQIITELGGGVIGAACFYPSLAILPEGKE